MKYHHVCSQCGNPTPEEQTNVVITDIMDDNSRSKQVYCLECFKGLTKETIQKNKKNNNSTTKSTTKKNNDLGCCSGH